MVSHGRMCLRRDEHLIFHGCVRVDEHGEFLPMHVSGRLHLGSDLFEAIEMRFTACLTNPHGKTWTYAGICGAGRNRRFLEKIGSPPSNAI